jgi:TonB-linked SusC/RagA family outer membrane protein
MKYLLLISLLFPITLLAQHYVVTGKVTDTDGQPVARATIRLLANNRSVTTTSNGTFTLQNVQASDSLELSCVGYQTQRVAVGSKAQLNLQMQRVDHTLEEVIVANTGYQKIKPNEATGSLTVVSNELYNQQPGFNVLDRIKTITNGIGAFPQRVGNGPASDLLVRGLSTLTRTIQKPLIILDDFEYQGELDNINPNDVENITVLKDAAASAIWGARAANGVIVITTKRSAFNRPTRVNFTSNIMAGSRPDLKAIREIASSDLVDLEVYLFSQNYRFGDTATPERYSFSPVYETLFARQKGALSPSEADDILNDLRNHDVRDDFNRLFYRNSMNQQYALSINGGAQNIAWGISLGLDKNISSLSQQTDRYTISLNNTYKPVKKLSVALSAMYSGTKNNSGAPRYGSIRGTSSALPIYTRLTDKNGDPLPFYNSYRQGFIDTLGGGRLLDWRYYPATDYQLATTTAHTQNMNAALGLDYAVTKWLTLKANYRYQLQYGVTEALYDEDSYFVRDLVNQFTQPGSTLKYGIPKGGILDYSNAWTHAQNLRGQLVVNHKWQANYLSFIAGGELSDAVTQSRSDRSYGYTADILTYVDVDLVNTQPMFFGGSGSIPDNKGINRTNTRFASFFANGLYTFKDRYSVSASARRDASNNFGVSTNDRWKPLWSAGVAWELSKEKFYRFKPLPYLKLRASYGYQGNVDLSKVAVITTRYRGTFSLTGRPYSDIDNFPNPELRWEQTAIVNLGLDYGFMGKRISGSIEYYRKHITDLYGEAPVDPTTGTGVTTMVKNMGSARGQGFDVMINTINIQGAFQWNTRFFLNTNHMKVLEYREVPALSEAVIGGSFTPINSYSPYSIFAYRWGGLDGTSGDPQGYVNGQVSKDYTSIVTQTDFASLIYKGSAIPTFTGNVSNDFRYKGFTLVVSMNYRLGYYIRKTSIDYSSLLSQLSGHSDYGRRWQQPGDESRTQIPSFVFPVNGHRDAFYKMSEILIAKGDHLRLGYVNLAYDLKRSPLKGIQTFKIFAVANNLGIIWKKDTAGINLSF